MTIRRPIWSVNNMVESGCEVHFTPHRQWVRGRDGRQLDLIRGIGVFFTIVRGGARRCPPTRSARW